MSSSSFASSSSSVSPYQNPDSGPAPCPDQCPPPPDDSSFVPDKFSLKPKTCPPPDDPAPCPCPDGDSGDPIRYWNGAIQSYRWPSDIRVRNGHFIGFRRTYNNRTHSTGAMGNNAFATQFAYAGAAGVGSTAPRAISFDPNHPNWFDYDSGSSQFLSRYKTPGHSVVLDSGAKRLTMTQVVKGLVTKTVLNDYDATVAPGQIISFTDILGGTTINNTTMGRIDSQERSIVVGGTTIYQAIIYAYYTSGTAVGKLQTVTYRKGSVASGTDTKQVTYEYYGAMDANGNQNDLKTVTQQQPDGSGGWQDIGVEYFRYYKAGDTNGFASGLKMRFGQEAYRRMFNALAGSASIDSASDATVKPYADNYFEYNSSTFAVTKEVAAVCPSCTGGGTTSDTFAYSVSSNTNGYNSWSNKTVQTLPNGATITVYTNYAGLVMLKVYIDPGGNKWGTFYKYEDTAGRNPNLLWKAHPSAVALPASLSTLEAFPDLMHLTGGSYAYLQPSIGLIEVNEYYDTTDTANGKILDYLAKKYVRKGQGGTDVLRQELTYTSNTDSNGVTIYPQWKVIDYPDDSTTATKITTAFTYEWYTGTNKLKKRTTTLPAVLSTQNGSGTAAAFVEEFDEAMNVTKRTDERGIVNLYEYDLTYNVVTKQTLNYQASPVGNPDENLITDYTYDDDGRLIQTLGPSHTALVGTATTVRTATWYIYIASIKPSSGTWELDQQWTGQGYATGSSPSYTYELIDPVSISHNDKNGRTIDQISSKRTTGSHALSTSDTFDQSTGDWKRWSSNQYNNQGQLTSSRVYFLIPTSGTGTSGTNYSQTDYGYDALERQNRVKTPGGTITRTVWTAPQRVASVWEGTNDTDATDSDPTGGGAPGNNMVVITENEFDGGNDQGNGTLTQVTKHADVSDNRVASYGYDFRDRGISITGEIDVYAEYAYDNLDRLTETRRKDTSSGGNLIGKSQNFYDDRSQVYQTKTFAVASGTAGNALTSNNWYDAAGNLVASIAEGAGQSAYSKTTYDAVSRPSGRYFGYNAAAVSYTNSTTINSDDVVFEQSIPVYDEVGNLLYSVAYHRWNTGTGNGALTSSNARLSYSATLYDGIGRTLAAVNYGAAGSFTPPSAIPSRSDTVLVTTINYNDAGEAYSVTDPKAIEAQETRDNAGRLNKRVDDYGGLAQTIDWTYTADGLVATLKATNSSTGDQTTTYTYGTTLSDSDVARSDLLRYVDYPDSVSGSDRVAMTYNRLGQMKGRTDQRGVVRSFLYDKLGRLSDDCATTLGGSGVVDSAIRRISRFYEVRGMINKISSYDNPTVGSGSIVNEVTMDFNEFTQLTKESQSHSGAVSSSPNVQYAYTNGGSSSNQIRPTGLTYPNGRAIVYTYGSSGSSNDRLNRIGTIDDGIVELAVYTYLGTGTVIRIDCVQPAIRLDLWGGTSGTFSGIDLFGRVIDQRWLTTGVSPVDKDRYKYGYDRNSNRQWRQNTVGSVLDELYSYDNLNRLVTMKRGTLSGTPPVITPPANQQDWTLDPTGNWNEFVTQTSGTPDLNQTRTQNKVNEITAISASVGTTWATPAYDTAGNMTSMPKPSSLGNSYTATYDAWNRMIQVKDGGTTVATYGYDGRDRRMKVDTGVVRHFYFTNNWQDVEERLGSLTTADQQYVWGIRYIDELICRDRLTSSGSSSSSSSSGGSGLNERLYVCQDANFNVTSLLDTSGNVAERYAYDAYGMRTIMNSSWSVLSTSAYMSVMAFQGLYLEASTGLTYNRNRMVHLALGRFLQRDPLDYHDSLNLAQDRQSNPVNVLDDSGLSTIGVQAKPHPGPPKKPISSCKIGSKVGFPIPHVDLTVVTDQGCYSVNGQGSVSLGITIENKNCPSSSDDYTDVSAEACACLIGNQKRLTDYNKKWESQHYDLFGLTGPNSGTTLRCWMKNCGTKINWASPPAWGFNRHYSDSQDCPDDQAC